MKAITIKQPWASLIIEGLKDVENRTWPTKFRGRVLVHASAAIDKNAIDRISLINDELAKKIKHELICNKLPLGVIIGHVEIVSCLCHTHHSINDTKSIWAEKDAWHWILANPTKIMEPIPAKGKLSFWDYPYVLAE